MGGYRRFLFAGASLLALVVSGCVDSSDGAGDAAGEATAFSERPASGRLVERDVEAPEVFQVTDKGLWDGRPSLGGVWVAYSDVSDPERVIIRNEANGQYVIGALFKRERENPGPRLQVSSDAAAALGMLAGAPTSLNVTALRREEPAPRAAAPAEAVAGDEGEDAQPADTAIAGAAAAIDRAEAGDASEDVASAATPEAAATAATAEKKSGWNPFRRKSKETPAPEAMVDSTVEAGAELAKDVGKEIATTEEVASVTVQDATTAIDETVEPVKKAGWNPFRRKPKDDMAADAATIDAVVAATAADSVIQRDASATAMVEVDDGITEIPGTIEQIEPAKARSGWNPFRRTPKETVVPAAASATALNVGSVTTTSLDAPRVIASEAAAAPGARQTAAASKLDKPYVQIGIFSVEANAEETATALRKNGVVPQVYKQESSGKTFWRVVAGPSVSQVDRAALLKKVKSMGFADAYPVRG